ncbi:LLM class flavin-dependent oxidoreductase [Tsuneonella sp. CC-YZS046]|uniref:LLM class flavin-dependent oxidoreductase n=1 Tax=Tsuneonella sp. CC-YZS046 TaxID=3042152 RepID=UPI002D798FCE|nr:LLM class flavin-dependent oxidoreductase [Tsuneonella sp. CC-YZS046]WRO67194.1 LLM class flavin-dependent oxidoreductase [Tsuneonella sp. CC-YZS046]
MRVGYMLMLASQHETLSDAQMFREEMRIAEMAEKWGYDAIWCPEHHFEDYSISVDNLQILSYLAGRTSTIKLGSAALILPWWNQPIRLAERVALLDALSGGRYILGFGRGLARREFETFGVPIEESRDRFDEMARMLLEAFDTGYIEGKGPHFPQVRTEIRPRLERDMKDRTYCVAMSPTSAQAIAEHDTRMMSFVQFEMEKLLPNIEIFRKEFVARHNRAAPPPLLVDDCFCSEDMGYAEEVVRKYLSAKYISILQHYEFLSDYHKELKGYEAYGESAKFLNDLGLEGAVEDYISHQAWGTPQAILDKLEGRRSIIGDYEWISICSFGGMPYDMVEKSADLLSKTVVPELKSWSPIEEVELV